MVKNIHNLGASLHQAPLYPSDRPLYLVIRNSNLTNSEPVISVNEDLAHAEVVLFDPERGEELDVLHRGKEFDARDFEKKKQSTPH